MSDFALNVGKGRVVELYNRVKSNDPADSAFVLVPLSASGTEAQGQDLDTLAAVLADANFTEQTTGWVRKTLTDSELAAFPAPNDTDNRYDVQVPEVTWTAPGAGNDTTGLLLCYDPASGTGDDTEIVPLNHHDFVVAGDDNDVVLGVGDFFQAS